jgi:hypothetical protein
VRVPVAIAAGLGLTAIAIAVTLTRAPLTVAGANATNVKTELTGTREDARVCQGGETLPAGTEAIRISLLSLLGPRTLVDVYAGGIRVTHGELGSGWTGKVATVPVARLARPVAGAQVCFAFEQIDQLVNLMGERTGTLPATARGGSEKLPGRVRLEYLRGGGPSWLSRAGTIVRHMGFGHAPGGAAGVVGLLGLLAVLISLPTWLMLRELR